MIRRLALAICLALPLAAAADPVTLRLALDAQRTLPSVPVGITITATNRSDVPAAIPSIIWMRLDNGSGRPVLLSASNAVDAPEGVGVPQQIRSIPPHSSITICRVTPNIFLMGTPWIGNTSVAGIGTFTLTALLSDDRPDPSDHNVLSSNSVELQATPFNDDDRNAWKWLVEKGRGSWTGLSWTVNDWADELLTRFPRSNYAPYAVVFARGTGISDRHDLARRVLAAFPQFPLADDVKLEFARRHRDEFLHLQRDDVAAAAANAEIARNLANEVLAHTVAPDVRTRAREILDHTPPRAEIMKAAR